MQKKQCPEMNHFLDTALRFPTPAKVATYQSAPLSVFHRPEKNIRKEGNGLVLPLVFL